jgi:hypothetical protein
VRSGHNGPERVSPMMRSARRFIGTLAARASSRSWRRACRWSRPPNTFLSVFTMEFRFASPPNPLTANDNNRVIFANSRRRFFRMEDEVLRTTQLLDRLGRAIDFPAYLAAHGFKVVPRSSEWGVTMDGTGGVVTLTMDPNKKKWTYAPVASSVNQGLKWTAEHW